MQQVNNKSKSIWRIEYITGFLIKTVILSGVFSLFFFNIIKFDNKILETLFWVYTSYSVVKFILEMTIFTNLHFENFNFSFENDEIYIKQGVLTIEEVTIPIKRVQHINIEQSLTSRFFDLYTLNIYTAGSNYSIEFLEKEFANQLKNTISNEVKVKVKGENNNETNDERSLHRDFVQEF